MQDEFDNGNDDFGSEQSTVPIKRRNVREIMTARPFRFCWVIFLVAVLVFSMPIGWLGNLIGNLNAMMLVRFLFGCGAIALLIHYNKGECFKIKKENLKHFYLLGLAIIVAVLNFPLFTLSSGEASIIPDLSAAHIASFVFWNLSVALFEELIFRALILSLLLLAFKKFRFAPLWAILVSSGAFGIVHILNIFSTPVGFVFMQVGYTFLLGLLWGTLYYFTKSIWPSVIAHFVFNMGGFFLNNTMFDYALGRGTFWNTPAIVAFSIACVIVGILVGTRMFFYVKALPPVVKDSDKDEV